MRYLRHHTFRIFSVALIAIFIGTLLIALYWTVRPADRLKSQRILHHLMLRVRYRNLDHPKEQLATATEVPILLYHGILTRPNDGFSIEQKDFEAQMVALKTAGYSSITTSQYLDFITGKHSLPAKSIMITFDDGRKDSYYRGDPILDVLGFNAVMYLTSGYSIVDGSKYYLDRDELLAMTHSLRWDIEAHADYAGTNQIVINATGNKGNFFGNLKWLPMLHRVETYDEYRTRITKEMSTVKFRLIDLLGKDSVSTLAFPFGDYGQQNKDFKISSILLDVARMNYQQTYAQFRKGEPYSSNYAGSKSFISRRIELNPNLSGQGLLDTLSSSIAKPSSFKAELNNKEGWQSDWGDTSFINGHMTISADKNATGATTYLDGTKTFSSYTVSVKASKLNDKSETLEIAALFQNSKNYVGCIFYKDKVKLERVQNGYRTELGIYNLESSYSENDKIGITSDGVSTATCSVGNEDVLQGKTLLRGVKGGPALIVRQTDPGKASVQINFFQLKKI